MKNNVKIHLDFLTNSFVSAIESFSFFSGVFCLVLNMLAFALTSVMTESSTTGLHSQGRHSGRG